MQNKPVAIVLGGTYPHITLLKKLRKRGFYTILIDYYENPPAKFDADEYIQESTLEKEAVLKIAREKRAELVISTCIDQANVTACYVSEILGLSKPYSYETALSVTNKVLMKKKMIENDIPTSKFYHLSSSDSIDKLTLRFPLIVKPVDSNSSKGVRKVETKNDIKEYLNYALSISRDKKAIIEEYKTGKEIGIDCFIKDGEAHVLMVKERRKLPFKKSDTQQIFGCLWPDETYMNNLEDYKKIANSIASAFELDNTPLMIQAIINEDEINVIEFAPRVGGGESFRIIQLSTGFDIIEAAIDSFLKIDTQPIYQKPKDIFAENFIYTKSARFGKLSGYQDLLDKGVVEYVDAYKTSNMQIGNELSSNNRVGVFTVKGSTKKEIFDKIKVAVESIDVFDTDGNSIMRKDIYSTLES